VQNVKANYKVRGNLIIEVEAETQRELFRELASLQEVFSEKRCGLCGCEAVIPVHRSVTVGKQTYEYCEWACTNTKCQARLSLGSMIEGGRLFPHRRLSANGKPDREKGTLDKHNGWSKYRGDPKDETPSTMPSTSRPTSATSIGNANGNNKK
jgi:hypothetical protein